MAVKTDYNKPHAYAKYPFKDFCKFCGMNQLDVIHFTPKVIEEIPVPVKTPTPTYESLIGVETAAKLDKGIFVPRGTIYRKEHGYTTGYLIETPPSIVEIEFDADHAYGAAKGVTTKGKVGVPWTYFWILVTRTLKEDYVSGKMVYICGEPSILWADDRVTDLKSIVYPARLPNVDYRTAHLCVGFTRDKQPSPIAAAEEYVQNFYSTKFNDHRSTGTMPHGDMSAANLKKWVAETKENPFAWMDWEISKEFKAPIQSFIGMG